MGETVLYERVGKVGIIKFNRPHVLNAINDELVGDFVRVLREAKNDLESRVLILKGEGRAFCAGADLKEVKERSIEEYRDHINDMQEITRLIWNMDKPIIAAVQGYALGGGCEFALGCDIRIAAEGALFGFPETSVGAVVTNAGTKTLPALVGLGRAREFFYTGERIDAKKAEAWGMVNKVVSPDELDKAVMEMAEKILKSFPLAIKLNRAAVNFALSASIEEVLVHEAQDGIASHAAGDMDRTRREKTWGKRGE